MIPSNLLDNTVILKSFTPDVPGDFSGGLVNVNTIDFPSALTLNVSYSTSYSSNTTFKDFRTYSGGKTDFLGIDDGTRSMPGNFPNNLERDVNSAEERFEAAQMFDNNWQTKTTKAPLNNSFMISIGDGFRLFNQDLGFIAALSYRNSYDNKSIERNEYEFSGEPRFLFTGEQSTYSVLWGGLFNLSYKVSDYHKISFKNTYTRTADDEVYQMQGFRYADAGAEQRQIALRFVSRNIYSGQIIGDHYFKPLNGLQAQWRLYNSTSNREEPDYRRIIYSREIGETGPYLALMGQNVSLENGGRFFSNLDESTNGAGLDFNFNINQVKIKLGGLYEKRERDFTSRLIGVVILPRTSGLGQGPTDRDLRSYAVDSIFSPENFRDRGFSIKEYINGTNNYGAGQTVTAAYLMADIPFTIFNQKFRFITGARVENARQTINTMDISVSEEINVDLSKSDILPSLNLIYQLDQNTNIRLAYSHTVNRPELRELAPFSYFDFATQTSVRGNVNLNRAFVKNYDIRFEIYPNIGEIISASFFYKNLTDAIEQAVISGISLGAERTFVNAQSARNYGFELEARISLGYLGSFLSDFAIRGNYSWIKSAVTVSSTETTLERTERPLQGQSPYMINLGLLYAHPTWGTSVNLLYNRFGERIMEVSTNFEEEVIEMPRDFIDLTISQPVLKNFELKLGIKDLLNQEQIYIQGERKSRGNLGGTSYSVGISYKL